MAGLGLALAGHGLAADPAAYNSTR
jgi:hypothetical protein